MTTVQQLYPWSYSTKSSDVVSVSDDSMREALETMREPHFYTGYSGLLSELGSASISVRVQGTEMKDVASMLMISDLAKAMLFQLTAFGFAVVSITKRRFSAGQSEFVVTQVRNAEEFTLGFQTQDSRRIYFAKENTRKGSGSGSGVHGVLQQLAQDMLDDIGPGASSSAGSPEGTVGSDPNAVFLLVVSRPPTSDGKLMSSASVISPIRKRLDDRMRTYQTQAFGHAYPLVYLAQEPIAIPGSLKETMGMGQSVQTGLADADAREILRQREEQISRSLQTESALKIVNPRFSPDGNSVQRPTGFINSSFRLVDGPNPVAPVFPTEQTESYVDQVSACLAVPRSYVTPNTSKVLTIEEQSTRETKLNAHFLAISTGLEKVLSHARALGSDSDSSSGSGSDSDSHAEELVLGEFDGAIDDDELQEEVEEQKRTRKQRKVVKMDRRLLVEVKITLALPLDCVLELVKQGFLKRDKGLQMMGKMLGLGMADLVTEKELETKKRDEAQFQADLRNQPSSSPPSSSSSSSSSEDDSDRPGPISKKPGSGKLGSKPEKKKEKKKKKSLKRKLDEK